MTTQNEIELELRGAVEIQRREFSVEIKRPDSEPDGSRTVELCFATEAPVKRRMGGEEVEEVLEINAASVNLERLNNGGPLLLEHEKQIGAVVRAWVGDDNKARAVVKFSRSRVASEVLDDVTDGIRRCVSVGYQVDRWARVVKDGVITMRATSWQAHEVSIVSMPADIRAGVGRSQESGNKENASINMETKQERIEVVQNDSASEIAALGRKYNLASDAVTFIERKATLDEFKNHVIEVQSVKPVQEPPARREVTGYSLGAMLRAAVDGRPLSGVEAEVHEKLTRMSGRGSNGYWAPAEAFSRTVTTATSPAYVPLLQQATIPSLNADSLAVRLGARVMSGLNGKLTFPRAGQATAAFLGETEAAAESDPNATALTLDGKRLCAVVKVSKRLLAQSNEDVEGVIKADIVNQLSLALDRAIFNGGGGVEPTGILGTSGVAAVAGGVTREGLVALEAAVATANGLGSSMAYIMTPSVAATLKNLQLGTSGRFVMEGNTLLGYAAHASTQSPANQIIFGDWSQVLITVFGGGVEVTVDTASGAASGIVSIIANQYCDAGVRQPGAFAFLD